MHIRVGVAAIILKNDQILLGKRKGSHGIGTWAPPGGHLEYREEPVDCMQRETREETGLEITHIRRGPWTSDIFDLENKHYITLFMIANYMSGEPKACEPEKCEEWLWFNWHELPKPLFKPMQNLLNLGYDWEQLITMKSPVK